MPASQTPSSGSIAPTQLKSLFVAGGAAGALTCTGIKANRDKIISVARFTTATFAPGTDLTSQFSISADDTITNLGGTATTGQLLYVLWWSMPTQL